MGGSSNEGSDCSIFCTSFEKPIDTHTVMGIELDGIYYPFE